MEIYEKKEMEYSKSILFNLFSIVDIIHFLYIQFDK